MENFFATNKKVDEKQDTSIENQYEKIFIEASEIIRTEISKFKPEDACKNCTNKDCKIEQKDIFTEYPGNCEYRNWQLKIITFLSGDYRQKLKNEYKSIMDKKQNYQCNKCGACCKLAINPYSYTQLKQQALKGNKYAHEFVSIYLPYETEELAKEADPKFYDNINKLVKDEKIYFYYCKNLKNNLCTIYEKRPDICKNFPNNPLKILPEKCSFQAWKDEISYQAMLLNAKIDIIEFYKGKLK